MRNSMDLMKRLTAFLLALLLVTTMVGADFFSLATEGVAEETTIEAEETEAASDSGAAAGVEEAVDTASGSDEEIAEDVIVEEPITEELGGEDEENQTSETEEEVENIANEDPDATDENIEDNENESEEDLDDEEIEDDEEDDEEEEEEEEDEEDELKKKECEHEWEYISNEDGTHTKRCTECGEEETEECEFDEDGVCIHCGYQLKKHEHEWEYISNGDGTHIKKCKECEEEELEDCEFDEDGVCIYCGYEDMTLEFQSFSKSFDGTVVTVSGYMPRKADVTIYRTSPEAMEKIVNSNLDEGVFTALDAYNITIYDRHGVMYQPEDDGNSVKVSFRGVDDLDEVNQKEEVQVYRIERDYSITEISADVVGEDVYFDAEHFTTYVAGTYLDELLVPLEYQNDFAIVARAGNGNSYTRVLRATFDIYKEDEEAITFNANVYRNLPDTVTTPVVEPSIASGTTTVSAEETGWLTVEIDLTETSPNNGYIAAGNRYSIVVSHDKDVTLVGGISRGDSEKTLIKQNQTTWNDNSELEDMFYLTADAVGEVKPTLELTDDPAGDYTVSSITVNDSRAVKASDGKYYIARMADSEDGISITATLSDPEIQRKITWSVGDNETSTATSNTVASVASSGTMSASLKGIGPGETKVFAKCGTSNQYITIVVLKFVIDTTEAIGETASYSTPYKGRELTTTDVPVYVYKDSSNTPVSNVGITFTGAKDAGKATVNITYSAGSTSLTYKRYFTISPLNVNETGTDGKTAFVAAKYTISGNTITNVTDVNTNSALGVTPDFNNRDFTASITGLSGIKYTIAIKGQGNYTGTTSVDYTPTDVSAALTVELSSSSRLLSCYYTGKNYVLTEVTDGGWSELTFKNSKGKEVTDVVKSGGAGNSTYKIYDYVEGYTADQYTGDESPKTAGMKAIVVTINAASFSGKIMTTFNIQKADMADTTIVWNDGKGQFKHTGDNVEPEPVTHFNVYLGYVSASETGELVDPSDYVPTYPVDHKKISDNPYILLTGAGKNFSASTKQQKSYTIIPNYELDLTVRIGDNGREYDGTDGTGYDTGYVRYYDKTTTAPSTTSGAIPSLRVILDGTLKYGTDYTYQIYDSYTSDTNYKDLSPNVGTKYIVITPIGDYAGNKVITATYKVAAKPITDADIVNNIAWGKNAKKKTFNGLNQTWTTAKSSSSLKSATTITGGIPSAWVTESYSNVDDPDLTITYGTDYLEEGVNYTIDYGSNYKNADTISPTIKGIGNYQGELSGSDYQYIIEPASLDGDNITAVANITGTPDLSYTGEKKYPEVTVSVGNPSTGVYTYNEVFTYNNPTDNFTVDYKDNQSPGIATITVIGKNNITGKAILTFEIGTNTSEYSEIWIAGKYQVKSSNKIGNDVPIKNSQGKTIGYTRYYKCPELTPTYTGSPYAGTVTVIGRDGETLTRNLHYYSSYKNATNVNTSTTYSTASSPYLKITGDGDYANNIAIIYFNILPAQMSEATIEYKTGPALDYEAGVVKTPEFTIKKGTKTLKQGTDYTIDYYDSYNETTDSGVAASQDAGRKVAVIKGINNFEGTVLKEYTVGTDISDAKISIYNSLDNTEIFVSGVENKSSKTSPMNVTWRNNKAPTIELTLNGALFDSTNYTVVQKSSLDNYTTVLSPSTYKYISRATTDINDENINIIEYAITGDGTKGYYGSTVVYYKINPQNISTDEDRISVTESMTTDQRYTGEELFMDPELVMACGVIPAGKPYSTTTSNVIPIVAGTDYLPAQVSIGTGVTPTGSNADAEIDGVGNFTGSAILHFKVIEGYVRLFKDNDTTEFFTTSGAADDTLHVNLGELYTYDGSVKCPAIKVTPTKSNVALTDAQRTIQYPNDMKTAGKKTIIIEIIGSSFVHQTIEVTYEIGTNDIKKFWGQVDDVVYTANDITTSNIDANSIIVKKTEDSDVQLLRGTDFELVTSITEDLDKINDYYAPQSYADIIVTDSLPSYKTNYIFVRGINAYSGYLKIPFSIVLDISSTTNTNQLAKVEFPNNKYLLDNEATDLIPTITYKLTPTATTFAGTIPQKSTVGATDKNNYVITRGNAGKPGPDDEIAVTGMYVCKGTAQAVPDTLGDPVCFLANLASYTGISLDVNTVYDYTGTIVNPKSKFVGLLGTENSDYTITYNYKKYKADATTPIVKTEAKDVGYYNVVVTASDTSKYYTSNTGTRFEFRIKYNLEKATMLFVDPDDRSKLITGKGYTGNEFPITKSVVITSNFTGDITADDFGDIYNYGANGDNVNLVNIYPKNNVVNPGPYTITATPRDSELVYGNYVKKVFSITGVSIKTADFSFVDGTTSFTYIGSEIEPAVQGTITVAGVTKVLTKDVDYSVKYYENTNVGNLTAYVGITGLGSYACEEFTPDNLKFSITKLNLNDPHVVVKVEDTTYSGYYLNPEVRSGEKKEDYMVVRRPSYSVLYVDDSKGIRNVLQEQSSTGVGDWTVDFWENDTVAATSTSATPPTLHIKQGNSGNVEDSTATGKYTIRQLNLNSGNISIGESESDFTGSAQNVYDIVKLTVNLDYTPPSGTKEPVPLIQKGSYTAIGDSICDYKITVTKGTTNYNDGLVTEPGIYNITITGMNSCTSAINTTFEIKPRSLSKNFHYYYDVGTSKFVEDNWESLYDSDNHKYVVKDSSGTGLRITIEDVETVNSDTNPTNLPNIKIEDMLLPGTGGNPYKVLSEEDYTVVPANNTTTGSAEWNRNGSINSNATIPNTSPKLIITGIGMYTDEIEIPYNIGKNIVSENLEIMYSIPYSDISEKKWKYEDATKDAGWHYTYTGVEMYPASVNISYANNGGRFSSANYDVSYIDSEGGTDLTNVGIKYVVITGKGNFCGTITQEYEIYRKTITESGDYANPAAIAAFTTEANSSNNNTFKTTGGELTFNVVGKQFTKDTAAEYLPGMGVKKTDTVDDTTKFINFYYDVYDGKEVKPAVKVTDHTLGKDGTTARAISAEDMVINYPTPETVSTFSYNGDQLNYTYSEIQISFKGSSVNDYASGGNYYCSSGGSAKYIIRYIIVHHDLAEDFSVQFMDGGNNRSYDYLDGKPVIPNIRVTNGVDSPLVQGEDYEVTYGERTIQDPYGTDVTLADNVLPGVATLTVTGINNYTGSVTEEFYISGDLSKTLIGYYDNGVFMSTDRPLQQYTGTSITYGEPRIYLFLPYSNSLTVDYVLKAGNEYVVSSTPPSEDNYLISGTVIYSGVPAQHWFNDRTVEYDVEYSEDDIQVINNEGTYKYTGNPIKPDFKINISSAAIGQIIYTRRDDPSSTDFTKPGIIDAEVPYTVGSHRGTVLTTYTIVPRQLTDSDVKIVYSQTNRYTGDQIKPSVSVFILMDDGIKTLTKDEHYTLSYGENIFANCSVTITGNDVEIKGTKKVYPQIVLGMPVNLQLTADSNSITANWVHDIYTAGEYVQIVETDSGKVVESKQLDASISGYTPSYTFKGLKSVTNYEVRVQSYQTINGDLKRSEYRTDNTTTGISSEDITVENTSSLHVKITWGDEGDVKIYKIYRSDETSGTKKIAVYPASSGSYTNVVPAAGTYTYYIEGYAIINNVLTLVSTSDEYTRNVV